MVQETENRYFMRRVIGWLACLGPVSMHTLPVWFNRLLLGTMSHSLLKGELVDLFINTMSHTMVYDVARHCLANLSSHKLTLSQQYHQSSKMPLWVFFSNPNPLTPQMSPNYFCIEKSWPKRYLSPGHNIPLFPKSYRQSFACTNSTNSSVGICWDFIKKKKQLDLHLNIFILHWNTTFIQFDIKSVLHPSLQTEIQV